MLESWARCRAAPTFSRRIQAHKPSAGQFVCSNQTQCHSARNRDPVSSYICNHCMPALLAGLFAVGCAQVPAASALEVTINIPASKDVEVQRAQKTLVEAWANVAGYYIDPTFNKLDWQAELQEALARTASAQSAPLVYDEIPKLLNKLDDEYTRLLEPQESQKYTEARDGKVYTTGLYVSRDPGIGSVRVSYVLPSSAADEAGVLAGDQLLELNGTSDLLDSFESTRQQLIHEPVSVRLAHSRPQPAVSGGTSQGTGGAAAPTTAGESVDAYVVDLLPREVDLEAVQYAAVPQPGGAPSVGYIRIVQFNLTTGPAVRQAVSSLQAQGAGSFLLDLRDNPGGAVGAGYEVAQMFLEPDSVFCYAIDRTGQEEEVKVPDDTAFTTAPMAVLVNHGTASTSELLAAALHDDHRAVLIGEDTFGKGRTQRVVPLSNGSTLLVSTIAYRTPAHKDIHKIGLHPDLACRPEIVEAETWVDGEREGAMLLDDPCIKLAVDQLAAS